MPFSYYPVYFLTISYLLDIPPNFLKIIRVNSFLHLFQQKKDIPKSILFVILYLIHAAPAPFQFILNRIQQNK